MTVGRGAPGSRRTEQLPDRTPDERKLSARSSSSRRKCGRRSNQWMPSGEVAEPDLHRGDVHGGPVHVVPLVVAGGHGAELLELIDAAFGGVALLVPRTVDLRRHGHPSRLPY